MLSFLATMGFKFLSRSSMRGEKATLGTSLGASLTPTLILRIVLRFFQFVMGLTVIGLYAVDLDNARKQGKYVDSKWVWAGNICFEQFTLGTKELQLFQLLVQVIFVFA